VRVCAGPVRSLSVCSIDCLRGCLLCCWFVVCCDEPKPKPNKYRKGGQTEGERRTARTAQRDRHRHKRNTQNESVHVCEQCKGRRAKENAPPQRTMRVSGEEDDAPGGRASARARALPTRAMASVERFSSRHTVRCILRNRRILRNRICSTNRRTRAHARGRHACANTRATASVRVILGIEPASATFQELRRERRQSPCEGPVRTRRTARYCIRIRIRHRAGRNNIRPNRWAERIRNRIRRRQSDRPPSRPHRLSVKRSQWEEDNAHGRHASISTTITVVRVHRCGCVSAMRGALCAVSVL
jgi:hypothetical protein